MIIHLSKDEVKKLDLNTIRKCKYPWRVKEPGEGFFVPREDMPREDYRPSPPRDLIESGQKWTIRKNVNMGKPGMYCIRMR